MHDATPSNSGCRSSSPIVTLYQQVPPPWLNRMPRPSGWGSEQFRIDDVHRNAVQTPLLSCCQDPHAPSFARAPCDHCFAGAPSKGGVYRMANFRVLDENSLSHQHSAEQSPQPTVTAAATATAEAEHPPPSTVATASTIIKPTKAAAKRTADGDDVDSKHFNDHMDSDYGGSVVQHCACLCSLSPPTAAHL